MDKTLLSKVKTVLSRCTPDNVGNVKKSLMVMLKPEQADDVYDYFIKEEPDYIKDNCKVFTVQVIPQYKDYFGGSTITNDSFFESYEVDEDIDLD